MKRLLALLLALTLLLSVSAVFAEDAAPADSAAEAAAGDTASAEPAESAAEDRLLVTINGDEIRESNETLQCYYEYYLEEMEEGTPYREEIARMSSMDMALKVQLIKQNAYAALTDEMEEAYEAQAEQEWEDLVNEEMEASYGITADASEDDRAAARADVINLLESYGWTEDVYIEKETETLIYNGYLTSVAEDLAARPEFAATEDEIRKAFEDRVEEDRSSIGNNVSNYEFSLYLGQDPYYTPAGYRGILHILLDVDQSLMDTWTDLTARLEETQKDEDDSEEPASEDASSEAAEAPAEPEEPVTPEMVKAAEQAILDSVAGQVAEIKEKLAAGAAFEDLIAEYGQDPGMEDPETLKNGYPVHAESILYYSPFTAAAAGLEKIGDVSEPVVTQSGVHILYYLRDIPEGAVELTDAIWEELKSTLEAEKQDDAFVAILNQWLTDAEVVWTEDGASWQYNQDIINQYASMEEEDEDSDVSVQVLGIEDEEEDEGGEDPEEGN